MKRLLVVVTFVLGCAGSQPAVNGPQMGPTSGPTPSNQEACPASGAAEGKPCTRMMGCPDPDRPDWDLVCTDGTWHAQPIPAPPCCKK